MRGWQLLAGLLVAAAGASAAVEVHEHDGGWRVDSGTAVAVIAANGKLLELSRAGQPNLLAAPDGWNPGLNVTLAPVGSEEKPVSLDESRAVAARPVVQLGDHETVLHFEQRLEPWLRATKTLSFAAHRPAVRMRWEVELLQPARLRRLGVTLVSSADADALGAPSAAGTQVLADHTPGRYFRTPAADEQAGFADFRRERWLALLARPRDEGLAVLFPDLEAWAGFRKQYNLASRLKDGGYVLEFANPAVPGNDAGGPGWRDYPAGARFTVDLALAPFGGDASAAARAALAGLGFTVAPSYPVQATAFPTHLTATFTGGVPTFHLVPGVPLAPAFAFAGDREAAGALTLVLDVPAGVNLVGASWLHPSLRAMLPLEPEALDRAGVAFRRYRLAVPPRVIGPTAPTWAGVLATFLEPAEGFESGDLVCHLEGAAGASAEQTVRLQTVAPLGDLPRPEGFELFPWYQATLSVPDQAIRERQLAALERLGTRYTSLQMLDPQVARQLKDRGWRLYLGMGFSDRGPYGFQLHNYGRIDWPARGYPDDVWVVDDQGQRHVGVFCPSYAAGGGELYDREYRAWLGDLLTPEARALAWAISNDFEPSDNGLMSARHSCFCPRCLERFAQAAGLAAADLPDAAAILARHNPAWTQFRMALNEGLIAHHTQVVRDLAPELVNSLCSHWVTDPPGSEVWPGEAVDVRRFDRYADQHTPMMYHGGTRLLDNLDRTRQALSKPMIVLTAAFYDAWGSSTVVFSPAEVRWNLVAIGALGAQGAGFYASLDHVDGAYLHAVQGALADLAALAPARRGERVDAGVTGLAANQRAYRWRGAEGDLVLLFNADGRDAAAVSVALGEAAMATDALTGERLAVEGQAVRVEVGATGYRALRLRR